MIVSDSDETDQAVLVALAGDSLGMFRSVHTACLCSLAWTPRLEVSGLVLRVPGYESTQESSCMPVLVQAALVRSSAHPHQACQVPVACHLGWYDFEFRDLGLAGRHSLSASQLKCAGMPWLAGPT